MPAQRSTPVLLPERVGRGTGFSLLAVPAGVLVSTLLWHLGLVSSVAGLVVGALAVTLYAHGSAGRLRKGIAVVAVVTLIGLAASLLAGVADDLWGSYGRLAAPMAAVYGSRWRFVADNLLYPGLLGQYPRTAILLLGLGLVGAAGGVLAVTRTNRTR